MLARALALPRFLVRSIALVAVMVLLAAGTTARASNAVGKLTGVLVVDQIIFFQVDTYAGGPACNITSRYVMSATDPGANQVLALLLTAYASQSVVNVQGTGGCNLYGNSETAHQVCIGTLPCY